MSTFVLVHGAWHGAWCWHRVRSQLQSRGHAVFTPTLTGLADRSHLLNRDVDLGTHIRDVTALLEWERLDNVVLCGHSYGGMVVTGVADRLPERLGALVYLDAFVPQRGQSLHDIVPPGLADAQLDTANAEGDGWLVPPLPASHFDLNAADAEWAESLFTPQPLATLTDKLELMHRDPPVTHVSYAFATGYTRTPFRPFYERAQQRGWQTPLIEGGHDLMLDNADAVTRMLVEAAVSAGVA